MDLEKGEEPDEEDAEYYKHFYDDVAVEIRRFISIFNHAPYPGLQLTTFLDKRRDQSFLFQVTTVRLVGGLHSTLEVSVKYII